MTKSLRKPLRKTDHNPWLPNSRQMVQLNSGVLFVCWAGVCLFMGFGSFWLLRVLVLFSCLGFFIWLWVYLLLGILFCLVRVFSCLFGGMFCLLSFFKLLWTWAKGSIIKFLKLCECQTLLLTDTNPTCSSGQRTYRAASRVLCQRNAVYTLIRHESSRRGLQRNCKLETLMWS